MLFSRSVYYIIIAILTVLLVSTLPQRVVHFDDAWGAELAYWLAEDGYAHSELFRGIGDGSEQQAYVFHKAFIYLEAGLIHVFGMSLYTVKAMGLLFSIVGLGLLLYYFRGKREAQRLATVVYIGCGALIAASFTGRPEPLTMSAGLASFLLLRQAHGRTGRLALAGLLGGLAGLAHLHGLIYLMAGGMWLLCQRARLAGIVSFCIVGAGTVLLYPLDALFNQDLAVLLQQFVHAPVTQANQHGWSKLMMLLNYQAVYFHSAREAFLTVLLLLVIALTWRKGDKGFSDAQQYTGLLILSFWILCARASGYYFLLLMPFFIIIVVELALQPRPYWPSWRRVLLRGLFVCYIVGAGGQVIRLWRARAETPWPATENALLAQHMPQRGSIAIVPLDFIFNEIENYRLRGLTSYAMRNREQYHDTLSIRGFFALAAQDSAKYIVTDHRMTNDVYHVPSNTPRQIGEYRRVFQTQWHSVYCHM